MTNIIFSRSVIYKESVSPHSDLNASQSNNPVQEYVSPKPDQDTSQSNNPFHETPEESQVKPALFSIFGTACFGCITSSPESTQILDEEVKLLNEETQIHSLEDLEKTTKSTIITPMNSAACSWHTSPKHVEFMSSSIPVFDEEDQIGPTNDWLSVQEKLVPIIMKRITSTTEIFNEGEPTYPVFELEKPRRPVMITYSRQSNFRKQIEKDDQLVDEYRMSRTKQRKPRIRNFENHIHGEQVAAGWPVWLSAVVGEAIHGWSPRSIDSFMKIRMTGKGIHGEVYKARDKLTGELVALKKVQFDYLVPESVMSMAKEIVILRQLEHPNIIKLKGLVTCRISCNLYLIFEYMEQDLDGLSMNPAIKFTVPQVKLYIHQLLLGLEYCHVRGIQHLNIEGSNLLIGHGGVLKIAGFGFASFFGPYYHSPKLLINSHRTNLSYQPPETLLGAKCYGVGVDLWSTGCILAEMFAGKPIFHGQCHKEIEQVHKIFKLCGSPSEEYWDNLQVPRVKLRCMYRRCIRETFKEFPPSSLPLIETLLAIDPIDRQTATAALRSEFFKIDPYACETSSLLQPLIKEMEVHLWNYYDSGMKPPGRKSRGSTGRTKTHRRNRPTRVFPAKKSNEERPANFDDCQDDTEERLPSRFNNVRKILEENEGLILQAGHGSRIERGRQHKR